MSLETAERLLDSMLDSGLPLSEDVLEEIRISLLSDLKAEAELNFG